MKLKYLLSYLPGLLVISVMLLGAFVGVYLIKQSTDLFPRAAGEPAKLVIDFKNSFPTSDNWNNFAQGGEDEDRMLGMVIEPLAELKPKYIRIDHIYDAYDVIKRNSSGSLEIDWTNLDKTIDDILATGAKPFLSLSYMPLVVSKSSEIDLPIKWGEWENLVRETVMHYSGVNQKAISDVYYEVWNEPDLFGNFKLSGEKNYLELYRHSVSPIINLGNTLPYKVGGPATTGLYANWFQGLLDFVEKNKLRLDFYSWHRYSTDADVFENDIEDARIWLSLFSKFGNLEFIISESGYSSENDVAYDTRLSAIHSLASITTLEGSLNKLFHFEVKDGPGGEQFWGRWGLLTNEKFGKPVKKDRYHALVFANQLLNGQRVSVSGQGTWVSAMVRKFDDVVKILVVNYDARNKHFESVPILFTNLPGDSFTIKRKDFMGVETGEREIILGANENSWSTVELMKPNSAAIFEITLE